MVSFKWYKSIVLYSAIILGIVAIILMIWVSFDADKYATGDYGLMHYGRVAFVSGMCTAGFLFFLCIASVVFFVLAFSFTGQCLSCLTCCCTCSSCLSFFILSIVLLTVTPSFDSATMLPNEIGEIEEIVCFYFLLIISFYSNLNNYYNN